MNTRSQTRFQNRSLIEKLPIEMLLEIFDYLDPWSIRRCSECCTTFFHVTLRPKFKHCFELNMTEVYLASHCGIGKIFSAGSRTIRKFEKLNLNVVNFKSLPFAKNFFMRLGREILELQIYPNFMKPLLMAKETSISETKIRQNILKNFPNLRKLVVGSSKILADLQYFPKSLEEVVVSNFIFSHDNLQTDYVDMVKIKKGATGLKKLIFSSISYVCFFLKEFSYKNQKFSDEMFKIIHELGGIYTLQSYETKCNVLDHAIVEPKCITGLTLNYLTRIPFDSLAKFPNLESIDLKIYREIATDCILDHEQALPDLSRVKKFKMNVNPGLICDTCTSKLFGSLPNLTHFEFKGTLSDAQARVIFANMPKLEMLELEGPIPGNFFDSAEYVEHSLEHLRNLRCLQINESRDDVAVGLHNDDLMRFSNLPNLDTLCLLQNGNFQMNGIKNLLQKCPNISNFTSQAATISPSMIQEMLRGWSRLKTLGLSLCLPLDDETLKVTKDNGRFLKYFCVSLDQPKLTFSEECSLFESIPSLNFIVLGHYMEDARFFTRSEYYEKELYLEMNSQVYDEKQLKRKIPSSNKTSKKRRLSYNSASLFNTIMRQSHENEFHHEVEDTESDDSDDSDFPNECAIA
ncbi:uncharacterized protein LOC134830617 [Culicoides brevitarsis]|uniref:uncharacterized protein LOC134830617 n=1 Tax=Culicoides brevitarsis TaxID=469753 RepID=UPI00307B4241